MKYIQGHTFTVKQKPKMNFVLGETYRIFHIAPMKEGIKYTFYSKGGNLEQTFESTDYAEKLIDKMSG